MQFSLLGHSLFDQAMQLLAGQAIQSAKGVVEGISGNHGANKRQPRNSDQTAAKGRLGVFDGSLLRVYWGTHPRTLRQTVGKTAVSRAIPVRRADNVQHLGGLQGLV